MKPKILSKIAIESAKVSMQGPSKKDEKSINVELVWKNKKEPYSIEYQITKLIAWGASNKEVAQELNISQLTARTHRRNIMRKGKALMIITSVLIDHGVDEEMIKRIVDIMEQEKNKPS